MQQLSGVISQEATVEWASPKWRRENRKAEYSTGESPQENHKEKYQDWSHRAEALKKKYSIDRMPNTINILIYTSGRQLGKTDELVTGT